MTAATAFPPHQASPPGPAADRTAAALPNLAKVLHVVGVLLAYGRHLADTFERRAAAPGFHIIARAFGTSNSAVILAHIRRGILRATALHEMLLERAARGRDLTIPPLRIRPARPARQDAALDAARDAASPPGTAASADPAAPSAPPGAPPARKPPPRPSWRDDWLDGVADPLDPRHLPSIAALKAEMRRRPFGRSIGDICADLGIAPVLCLASFWNELFFAILHYDGSAALYEVRRWRREEQFAREQDRRPTLDLAWPPLERGGGRGDILRVTGFFIGEEPAEPAIIRPPPGAEDAHGPGVTDGPGMTDAPPHAPEGPLARPAANAATGPP